MAEDFECIASFIDGDGKLIAMPSKKKRQLYAIWYIASKIDSGKTYTEREINEAINSLTVFKDPATLRREMYDRFLLDRSPDCREYRMRSDMPTLEDFVQRNTQVTLGGREKAQKDIFVFVKAICKFICVLILYY